MTVLVVGATGTVGRPLVAELLGAGQQVRAGVRDPDRADLPAGAVPVRLDLDDPATVAPALGEADLLFLMRPPAMSDVRTGLGPLVAVAATQVRHVAVLSVLGVNPAMPHWHMEQMVRRAGLASTALRPAYFSQNLLTAFGDDLRRRSQLRLASGAGRVSFVDTRDVAAVAARVLLEPDRHGGAPLTLTGPEALTFHDAAALLTADLGRPVTYVRQTLLQRRRELRARGDAPGLLRVQLVIDITTRLGLAKQVTADVPRVLGRPATTLAEFVHDHRDAWL